MVAICKSIYEVYSTRFLHIFLRSGLLKNTFGWGNTVWRVSTLETCVTPHGSNCDIAGARSEVVFRSGDKNIKSRIS